jgi:hypothetical protein
VARARQAESEALAEYSRILRAFTDLTVNGKVPEEWSVAGSDSYEIRFGQNIDC